MAQRKILLDTCVYLRLAQHVHPLLQQEFGQEAYCCYVIPEFDEEYARQPRLHQTHPWVNHEMYQGNRRGNVTLSRQERRLRKNLILSLDTSAREQDIDLSRVDIAAMSTALVVNIPLATDDTGIRDLAMVHGLETLGSLELLRLMMDAGRVATDQVIEILHYLESLPDLPSSFHYDRSRLFPELRA